MAKEFSFEEAIAAPAKAPASKEFSFEEAIGSTPKEAPKATQAASDAEYDFGSPMGTGTEEIMAAAKPKKRSVLEGQQMPEPAPTEDKYVVNPQFINAVQAKLNAMPAENREAALAAMAKRSDVYGRAARAIAGRYEAADKGVSSTVSKLTDMRLEQQTQRFIDQGASPEVAEGLARNQALSGQARPDLAQMRETPEEVQAGMELAYDPKLQGIDATIRAVERMGLKTAMALGQAGGGMQVFAGDLLGLDTSDKQDTLKKMHSFTQAMGDPALKPLSVLESAITSIGQQLPAMVMGAVTGSEPLVLAAMFANSFGQNYEEGRREKLDLADSTARAAANATFEVIGEKFGLKGNINAIKQAAKGVPTDQLANFFAITLKKDVPGELLTHAGQYAVDMGFGMKPEASIQNFIQGSIDTMLATVVQGSIMAGGRKALTAVVGKGGAKPEVAEQKTTQSAEELAKSKGFLISQPAKTEVGKEFSFEEAIKPAKEAAAPAEDVKTISERLQAQGIPQRIADAIAEKEVQKNEPAEVEARGAEDVTRPIGEPSGKSVSVAGQPSAEPPAGGVAEAEPSGVVSTGQDVTGAPAGEAVEPSALTDEEKIKAEDERNAAYEAKKANAQQIARANASTAFDQLGEYGGDLDAALDSYRTNMADTLVEEGLKNDEDWGPLLDAANRAFEDEVNIQKGTTSGIETPEAIKATQKGQAAPATGAVAGKTRGRPPVQQRHVVTENSEGEFDLVTDGEVVTTYANKKQATAAVNLAKAQDRGDAARVAKFQAELDKALASKGRGRSAAPVVETEAGTEKVDKETREELGELESALKTYNSTTDDGEAKHSAMYIAEAAVDPTVPKMVRKRAQQMLEDEIDPKDLSKGLRSSEGKVAKADTGFSKLTNGSQAIAHIIKTGNLFQRFVAERIRNFMVDVKFVVLERGDAIPPQMRGARGLFVYTPGAKDRTIYVRGASFGDMQGINVITVLHELLHAATASRIDSGLFKGFRNASLQKFMREMNGLMKAVEVEYRKGVRTGTISSDLQDLVEADAENVKFDNFGRPKFEIFNSPHEFLAYGMSSPEFQKFLMSIQGTRGTGFTGFVNNIRDLFGIKQGDATAFSDLVDITDKMLNTRLTKVNTKGGALQQKSIKDQRKELNRAVTVATEAVATSRAGNELGSATADLAKWRDPRYLWGELKGLYDENNDKVRSAISNFYDSEALAYAGPGDVISGLKDAHEAIQKMAASTQTYMRGVANTSEMVVKFFRENPNLRQPFEDLVQETTLAKYDPSDLSRTVRSKKLDADYAALGKDGQKVYQQLRDYYKTLNAVKQHLLEENINKLGLDAEARRKLLADVRVIFEQDKIEPYFPLARFGDFVLEVGKRGSHASYRFETMRERDRAAREHAAKQGKTIDELRKDGELSTSEDSDGTKLRSTIEGASKLLKSVYAAVDSADMADSTAKQKLKDTLYQSYLAAMPENSVRKMFIHRKGTPGFSSDILRTINVTGLKMSRALAKLEHASDIRSALDLANRELDNGNDKYKPFVKRMEELAANALQPNPQTDAGKWFDSAMGFIAKISFLRNLTSWSSAIMQPADIILVGAPVLSGNHGAKAIPALMNRLKLTSQYGVTEYLADGTVRYRAPSVEYAKGITPLQRRAIRDMVDLYGVTKDTLANAVFSRASKATVDVHSKAYEMGKTAVDNLLLGGLMHHGERLSREIIALTSFDLYMAELEKASPGNPMNFHEAVKLAVRETHEALGNYGESNRPLIMRGGFGKLVTMYKFFPLVRTKLLGVNFFKMIPILNKQGKKEAATKFFGVLGTHLLLGGYTALPAFSLVMSALGALWARWQKDPDAPDDMKSIDYETWWRTEYIPNMLGNTKLSKLAEFGAINYMTGVDFSSRISLNDMWFRDPQPGKTLKDSFLNWGQVLGGAAVSTGLGMAQGLQMMSQGEFERGLEKAIPLGSLSKLLIAARYASEGIQTPTGEQLALKGKVPTSELVGQAIGFAPASLAEAQTRAFKASAANKVVAAERANIVHTLVESFRKSIDPNRPFNQNERFDKIFNETLEKMDNFNMRNPANQIEDSQVFTLIEATLDKIAESEMGGGVRETEKNYELVGPSSRAAVRALTPYNK